MLDAWIWGTLTLTFGLLSSLQGVSFNETVNTCDILNCTKGFTCCDNGCCPERKFWDLENNRFRCTDLQHDVRTSDHQTPPEPPSIAPLESIWVTSLDPPPPYSQVVQMPTPTEPPPPYSLRPEGPAGQMRGRAYATL
ncbi:transmembrane protein 92-like isoform X3 [Mus musculus]|uniref:transmembrane protein 92-like isoform X3 n=1 Tax=Mus musculus TaxID=10090 RepID=UPI0003D772BC|nr:transmembrane protein 92-like isoform X3 [Mus musculus]|eukprot:XP_006534673.1 PREDICTED: transmembrane protein 92-like isoform X3 [Mus musculus]